jgi:hypothetical protein
MTAALDLLREYVALDDKHFPSAAPHEWMQWNDKVRAVVAEHDARPVLAPFDRATALILLEAASKSGDAGAISLAAQLAGAAPCEACGFVNYRCRCKTPNVR